MRDNKNILCWIMRCVPRLVIIRLGRIIPVLVWIARLSRAVTEKTAKISPLSFSVNCLCVSLLCSLFSFPSPANAHKVNIFAYAQEGKVYAEGYFVDGTKCKNSVVEVIDSKTKENLLEGKTDDNGRMTFVIPRATSLKLVLRAGEGHQGEYVLTEEEIRSAMPAENRQTETRAEPKKRDAPEKKQPKSEGLIEERKTVAPRVYSEELEAAVGKIIDSKLQPVMKILLELREKGGKPGVTEVLGGIGYIIGILGIIAYFKGKGSSGTKK